MDEVRLIDGNALEQEMREFAAQIFVGCHRTTTDSEEVVHTCADMVNEAPTIDPESLPPYWRKTAEDPPTREDGNEIGSILCAGYHCNIRDGGGTDEPPQGSAAAVHSGDGGRIRTDPRRL